MHCATASPHRSSNMHISDLSLTGVHSSSLGEERVSRKAKICGVCGDRAKSYHFGGISCDSCKAFFRRSVQNEGFRSFRCGFQGNCRITMANRKCCQHCRFNKCLDIGMETTWVMSEEERVHLMHNRMSSSSTSSKHFCHASQRLQLPLATIVSDNCHATYSVFTPNETQEIDGIVGLFKLTFLPEVSAAKADALLVSEFVTSIQRLVKFARQIPRFSRFSSYVQVALLRANIFEMFVVMHVISRAAVDKNAAAENEVQCSLCEFVSQASALSLTLRHSVTDTPTLVLFLMVILFSSDAISHPGDDRPQLHYCCLLEKYLRSRSGSESNGGSGSSSLALAKLLLLLPSLREIRDKHLSHPFHLNGHH